MIFLYPAQCNRLNTQLLASLRESVWAKTYPTLSRRAIKTFVGEYNAKYIHLAQVHQSTHTQHATVRQLADHSQEVLTPSCQGVPNQNHRLVQQNKQTCTPVKIYLFLQMSENT